MRTILRAGAAVLGCCAVVIVVLALRGVRMDQEAAANGITPDSGKLFFARLHNWPVSSLLHVRPDSVARPGASSLLLFEDGKRLGPPHSPHEFIRRDGGGAFSHWDDTTALYFSSSDGSDPRANGRRYTVWAVVYPSIWLTGAASLFLAALAWFARGMLAELARRLWRGVAPVAEAAGVQAVAAAVAATALAFLLVTGLRVEQRIDPPAIAQDDGVGYRASLDRWPVPWPMRVEFDSNSDGMASTVTVREDGRTLGPPHSVHDHIRAAGKGRFSHWGDARALAFSASDNSDPRSNGRVYSLQARAELPLWTALVIMALGWFALRAARRWAASESGATVLRSRAARALFAPDSAIRSVAAWLRSNIAPPVVGSLVALAVVALAGEAYFRLTRPFLQPEWPSQFNADVGWLFKPNARVRWTNHLDFWTEETTNSLGFLDRERAAPRTDACRIAFIGDSFIEAAQLPITEKIQVVVEKLGETRTPARRIQAAGFGYSGTGQLNELPFYDRFARDFRPALVVLVFVANDFANNSALLESVRYGFHPDHTPRPYARRDADGTIVHAPVDAVWERYLLPVGDGTMPPKCGLCAWHRKAVNASAFYRWIVLKLRLLAPQLLVAVEPPASKSVEVARVEALIKEPRFARALGSWRGQPAVDDVFFEQDLPPAFQEAIDFTAFAFAEFKRQVAGDGASLVILSTSSVRRPEMKNPDLYFRRMHALAASLGIPVLDQFAWLKARAEDPDAVVFWHDGHWNPRGHQSAAEMVLDYVGAHPQVCERKSGVQP